MPQSVKYRYIRREVNVSGRDNDVERALNKFAGHGYKVISAVTRKDPETEVDYIYFVLERPVYADVQPAKAAKQA